MELDLAKKVAGFLITIFCSLTLLAQSSPVEIGLSLKDPFRFVAYGDTRFTNPNRNAAANADIRQALVKGIADAQPAFISIGGDIVYKGDSKDDWQVYDRETAVWRQKHIAVYPALGNHDLAGNLREDLDNYFARFPDLQRSRYYSVRGANILVLNLDSSEDETAGAQGHWLTSKLDTLTPDIDFVFIVLHHPPYTHSSETEILRGGGHSARTPEKRLAEMLEEREPRMHAQIIVIAGHVHNYERFEHGGITYFVSGGGGAHPYYIPRASNDPLRKFEVNYHYLLVDVKKDSVNITMNRVEMVNGKPSWSQPDHVTIEAKKS